MSADRESLPWAVSEVKTFVFSTHGLKGGGIKLAITKERKQELVTRYQEWIERSHALILTEYAGLSTSALDDLRSKLREVGAEFHIVKNTLGKLALQAAGMPLEQGLLEGTTAIGYALEDAPALAKALTEFSKSTDFLVIKGGYLGKELITAEEITALAELPPLPAMRARILGTLMAPATQLALILNEPARQLAQVIKAHADREAAAEAS